MLTTSSTHLVLPGGCIIAPQFIILIAEVFDSFIVEQHVRCSALSLVVQGIHDLANLHSGMHQNCMRKGTVPRLPTENAPRSKAKEALPLPKGVLALLLAGSGNAGKPRDRPQQASKQAMV